MFESGVYSIVVLGIRILYNRDCFFVFGLGFLVKVYIFFLEVGAWKIRNGVKGDVVLDIKYYERSLGEKCYRDF